MVAVALPQNGVECASRWYAVQTLPHRELSAEQQLRRQGFKPFLPVHWKTTRHARAFRTARAPFFPGYLFVKLTLGRDRWRSVNGTFGVSRLVMAGDLPQPVPIGIVEGLQALCHQDGIVSFETDLAPGKLARVLSGPFAGCIGEMTRLTPAGRVQLLLEILGGQVSVSVRQDALAPVA